MHECAFNMGEQWWYLEFFLTEDDISSICTQICETFKGEVALSGDEKVHN